MTEGGAAGNAAQAVALLRNPATIRARATHLLARAREGRSEHFRVCDSAVAPAAALVARITRERYPGQIPPHSRWRHFEAAGVDRIAQVLEPLLRVQAVQDRWMALADLCIVSVLLDAGAGSLWRYQAPDGSVHQRSEGLALASLYSFCAGNFSHDSGHPLQVSARGLHALSASCLAASLQCHPGNRMPGFEGRHALLRSLGALIEEKPQDFGHLGRPCGLLAEAVESGQAVDPEKVLGLLLERLGPIWPSPSRIAAYPLGDCWRHPHLEGEGLSCGWMPFHKLSQWLAYSLGEALQRAGLQVETSTALTGLPEYRNGGLMIDTGILVFKDVEAQQRSYTVDDPLVVEWRALTVALLEEVAVAVRLALGLDAQALPLACVLEGGTWAAGRLLANARRGGNPPLEVQLTGTVF